VAPGVLDRKQHDPCQNRNSRDRKRTFRRLGIQVRMPINNRTPIVWSYWDAQIWCTRIMMMINNRLSANHRTMIGISGVFRRSVFQNGTLSLCDSASRTHPGFGISPRHQETTPMMSDLAVSLGSNAVAWFYSTLGNSAPVKQVITGNCAPRIQRSNCMINNACPYTCMLE